MSMNNRYCGEFRGKNVLVTGGLGFIGSNLAIRLVELGGNVVIMDIKLPDHGANLFNIRPIRDKISIHINDIRDEKATNRLVKDKDYIFHLAGQSSHILSLTDPFPDIDINIKGTAILMEACKKNNPGVKVIYTGTRGQYGPTIKLPVNEEAPTNPKGIYEISNLTAEKIIMVYNDIHKIKSVLLRLTNIYGPRAQMKHDRYGVLNWFVRLAIDNQAIKVFGDGKILRDFLYVDECVEAILMSVVCTEAVGKIFNVGIDKGISFLETVKTVIEVAGSGGWEFAPFTPERAAQEPGNFYSDISKIKRIVGWQPKTSLREGLRITIEYYKKYKDKYW